jgi:hypothetical protein
MASALDLDSIDMVGIEEEGVLPRATIDGGSFLGVSYFCRNLGGGATAEASRKAVMAACISPIREEERNSNI